MSKRIPRISCAEANEIDIVSYLGSIGYHPTKTRSNDYWYSSPLRIERTPSFKVNRKINRWYDHGIAEGGTLLDLLIRLRQCDLPEALEILSNNGYFPLPPQQPNQLSVEVKVAKLKITSVLPLTSPALLNYLNERTIATKLAQQYCVQLKYRFEQRDYFGIGFPNLSGGYEIRNPFYKYSSAPKDISLFKNGGEAISVFEGFMDFLAFLSVKDGEHQSTDFLVLNGIGFFERARYIMEDYKKISLYLDRDKAGMETTQKALSISPLYEDRSKGYSNFKDVNEWAVHLKERPHCKISRRLR